MSDIYCQSYSFFILPYSQHEHFALAIGLNSKHNKFCCQDIALRFKWNFERRRDSVGRKIFIVGSGLVPDVEEDGHIWLIFFAADGESEFYKLLNLDGFHVEKSSVVGEHFDHLRIFSDWICFGVAVSDVSFGADAVVGEGVAVGVIGAGWEEVAGLVDGYHGRHAEQEGCNDKPHKIKI